MKNIDRMRPMDSYDKVIYQREKDARDFYEKYSMKFVDVSCPACGDITDEIAFVKSGNSKERGYNHIICSNCHTLFVSPRPTDDLINIFYSKFDAPKMWMDLLLEADYDRKMLQYAPRIQKILELVDDKNCKTAIDLGAGSGAFASVLQKTGRFDKVIAFDISQECVDSCKKQGIEAYCTSIDMIEDNSADIIFMNDLLEHLFSPKEFLVKCYDILRTEEGGYLSIATPNVEGFDFQILKESTGNITPPEHLNYFNTNSVVLLLESTGFTDIKVATPGILDVDIVNKARIEKRGGLDLSRNNEYLDFLFNRDDEVKTLFQEFLQKAKLSSHMLVLARKGRKIIDKSLDI